MTKRGTVGPNQNFHKFTSGYLMLPFETKQKELFERICSQYKSHYDDRFSRLYRTTYFNNPMFSDITLKGLHVLDAMCGNGPASDYLSSMGARVFGLDLSFSMTRSYSRNINARAIQASALRIPFKDNSFDCVVIQGGLHHIHPGVTDVINEVHRVLKLGGYFLFSEPHSGSIPDIFRKFWYRHDSFFEQNEKSVDTIRLANDNKDRFRNCRCTYNGALGYLLVYNSLIFRIPAWLKAMIAPPLLFSEKITHPFLNKYFSCFVVCKWQKY